MCVRRMIHVRAERQTSRVIATLIRRDQIPKIVSRDGNTRDLAQQLQDLVANVVFVKWSRRTALNPLENGEDFGGFHYLIG